MSRPDLLRPVGDRLVPALGVGTWAMGGPWTFDGKAAGWGEVDDAVSVAALQSALDGGVRLVDTADAYGCGHAERVVGQAIAPFRDDIVLVTKVGLLTDEATRTGGGSDLSPAHLRSACDASLRRLGTDRIDVYLIHPGDAGVEEVEEAVPVLEELAAAGKIRAYGSSATDPSVVAVLATGAHAVAVEQELSVFSADEPALAACDAHDLAVLARTPLAMGLLSGRYTRPDQLPDSDVRRQTPYWTFFDDEQMASWLRRLDSAREILSSGGRTLVQGALAYVWGRSSRAVAVPGVRTPEQASEQAGALALGPLTPAQVAEVDALVGATVHR